MSISSRFLGAAVLFLLLVFGKKGAAQATLGLSLLEDGETFVVSLISQNDWPAPLNTIGAAQVVIRAEANASFAATEITSLIPGTTWSDNVYLDDLSGTSDYQFVCFTLNEKGTRNIPFTAGVETPLFSFKNAGGECPGELHLIDNQDPYVLEVVQTDHVNITQNLAVLGARGNAFEGVYTQPVSCETSNIGKHLNFQHFVAFPNPVNSELTLSWALSNGGYVNELRVTTLDGKLVTTLPIANRATEITVDVKQWSSGLYLGHLSGSEGIAKSFSFIVAQP
jgi:hypothetical protein